MTEASVRPYYRYPVGGGKTREVSVEVHDRQATVSVINCGSPVARVHIDHHEAAALAAGVNSGSGAHGVLADWIDEHPGSLWAIDGPADSPALVAAALRGVTMTDGGADRAD